MDWNRLLSLILAVSYVVGALVLGGFDGTVFVVFGYLVFSLGCIWYSDEMGDFVGIASKGIYISSPTPGRLIRIVGWLFLLLPVLAALIFGL